MSDANSSKAVLVLLVVNTVLLGMLVMGTFFCPSSQKGYCAKGPGKMCPYTQKGSGSTEPMKGSATQQP